MNARQISISLAIALFFCAPRGVVAQTSKIIIEAEDYIGYYEISGERIHSVSDPCESNYMLVGLDVSGEWTTHPILGNFEAGSSFSMRCRGLEGVAYGLVLTVVPIPTGNPFVITFSFTARGMQCGSWVKVQGFGTVPEQSASAYLAQLTTSGGALQIDNVALDPPLPIVTPATSTTWGAIKSLYR